MSEPEIARRCPTCGATIREVALFCPQCGNPQPPQQAQQAPPATDQKPIANNPAPVDEKKAEVPQWLMAPTIEIQKPEETRPVKTNAPSMSDTARVQRAEEAPPVPAKAQSMSDTIAIERPEAAAKAADAPRPPATGGARLRPNTLARKDEGEDVHGIRKVRQISSVVLDEAGYDPGLRFLLVAAVLFVVFLVIVLLNKLIG